MKKLFLTLLALLPTVCFAEPLSAQTSPMAEPVLTTEEIAAACVRDEAETLPLPFTDLDVNHWAFEAVMNLYYGCFAHKLAAQQHSFDPAVQPTDLFQSPAGNGRAEAGEL